MKTNVIGALAVIGVALLASPAEAHRGGNGGVRIVRVVPVTRAPGANVLLSVNRFALRGTGFTVNNGIVPPLLRPTIPVSATGLRVVNFNGFGGSTAFVNSGSTAFVNNGNRAFNSRTVVVGDTTVPSGQIAVIRGTSTSFVAVGGG
jgi:hypothetical protein